MADVEAAAAAPVAPLQLELAPPPERGRAARAAWALHRSLTLASHVALSALLAAIWTCSFTNAVRIAMRWVFGTGYPMAALELYYFDLSICTLLILGTVSLVLVVALLLHSVVVSLLLRRRQRREGEARAREIGEEYAATVAALAVARRERNRQEGIQDEHDHPVGTFDVVTMIVLLIGMGVALLMVLLAPSPPASWRVWLGSLLFDGSFFLLSLVFCYEVFPGIAAGVIAQWDEVRDHAAVSTFLYIA